MREILNLEDDNSIRIDEVKEGPILTPALIVRGKVHKAKSANDTHYNVYRDLPEHLQQLFDDESGDAARVRGYVDHIGRYLDARQALRYAEKHDLIDTARMQSAGISSLDVLVTEFLRRQH